jgi:hypothetical protein
MTTSIYYRFVSDVSRKNDTLVLETPELNLAAGVWTLLREDRLDASRIACLRYVVDSLCNQEPGWERWVIIGHRAFQPRNALAKHLGIRKYLGKQGINFKALEFIEQAHEYDAGLRFVGATPWDISEVGAVNAAMMKERAVIIMAKAAQARDIMINVVGNRWTPDKGEPFGVLDAAAHESVVVIDTYGEFDDREIAVAAIGRVEVLATLGVGPEQRESS